MSQSNRWGGLRHLKDLIQWLALLSAQLGLNKSSFKQGHCSKEILSFVCPPVQPYKSWTASIFTNHLLSVLLQNFLDTASPWQGIFYFGCLALYSGLISIDDMQISWVQSHQHYELSAPYHEDYRGKRECHPQCAYGLEVNSQQSLSEGQWKTRVFHHYCLAGYIFLCIKCLITYLKHLCSG